jgi:hypothetical protein
METLIFWIGGVCFAAIVGTIIIVICEYIGRFL